MLYLFLISIAICLARFEADEHESCLAVYLRFSKDHSYCKPPNPQCKTDISSVFKKDIEIILKEHNNYRSRIATGKENSFPSASNMLEMVWDEELAAVAQKRASQCLFDHDCKTCRQVLNFPVGQNIAQEMTTLPNEDPHWPAIIKNLFDEIKLFPKSAIEPFIHNPSYGHFTQIVWADTWRIGCGYVRFQDGLWYRKLYVCNYGPAGNIENKSMYKQGKECSECPLNSCCGETCTGATFSGLCKITDNKSPNYKPNGNRDLFYCDFSDLSQCRTGNITGIKKFDNIITLSGKFISITLNGGEESTMLFDTVLKPQGNSFCLVIFYRTSPSKDGDEDGGKITLIIEFLDNGQRWIVDLPNYYGPLRHKFNKFSYTIGSKKEAKFALKFSVPKGKPEQILEVSKIYSYNGKCQK